MIKNDKVRVTICGKNFYLTSGDDPAYLKKIADKVDSIMSELLKNNIGLTIEHAAILTAINFCDDYEKRLISEEKESEGDENLRGILVKYSKDLTRAQQRIKQLEKELETAKKVQGTR